MFSHNNKNSPRILWIKITENKSINTLKELRFKTCVSKSLNTNTILLCVHYLLRMCTILAQKSCVVVIFQGHDTTASCCLFTLWALAKHQDVQVNLLDHSTIVPAANTCLFRRGMPAPSASAPFLTLTRYTVLINMNIAHLRHVCAQVCHLEGERHCRGTNLGFYVWHLSRFETMASRSKDGICCKTGILF